jgi:hypothetical protein
MHNGRRIMDVSRSSKTVRHLTPPVKQVVRRSFKFVVQQGLGEMCANLEQGQEACKALGVYGQACSPVHWGGGVGRI